jgi:predicted membrane protein
MAKNKKNRGTGYGFIGFVASLIKELGIPAFVVLFFTVVFFKVATIDQEKEFVDEFFLFKDVNKNPFPFSFVVVALILIIILLFVFYNKIIENQKQEIKRIAEEKSELQSRMAGKNLHSSKNK